MARKNKGDDEDEGAENEGVDGDEDSDGPDPSALAGYIGLGLVGSLIVGFDPLRDAFQGNGSFENAVLRFLACVAVCVVGAGALGRLIDAVPIEEDNEGAATVQEGSVEIADTATATSGSTGRQDTESQL